ncbi:MAG TPA: CGNR zinc finger domain-containing protein [Nitriliruptorales bacterium]|nr:CGNR zinc finger domain-containing protein [Nitriliruptorales bacterium]
MPDRETRAPAEDHRDPKVPSDDPTGAPGRLGVVEAFVNTVDLESGRDALSDPTQLGRWLAQHGLLLRGERIHEPADLQRALRLRESLRELAFANHDGEAPSPAALEALNAEASRLPLSMRFDDHPAAALRPASRGIDGALATLLVIVFEAMRDGTWSRLKACRSASCRWVFYDTSRNRSGRWCSMAVCGNRQKVRAFRARRADGA